MEAGADGPGHNGTELDIRRFDPSTIKPHRIVVAIGKRGTGKSVLLRDILHSQRHRLEYGIAMTPTHESAASFEAFMPPSSVYREYRGDVVTTMLDMQRTKSHEHGMDALRSMFLVLDDCMYDKAVMKSKTIRDLFMNGRHYKCFFIAAVQWLMDLGPDLRTQVDYVVALRENIVSNRERLYKYFFGVFPNYEDFSRVFDACTANFECLVIDNTVNSNKIEDCIFWYKANHQIPEFRLCSPCYWELDRARTGAAGGGGGGGAAAADGGAQPEEPKPSVVETTPTKNAPRLRRIVKHTGALPGVNTTNCKSPPGQ